MLTTGTRSVGSASSTANPGVEPADLQQVGEQLLEPVELGVQQFGAAGHQRVELVTAGEDQVGRHPYGGQRRAQLVRHVRGEPPLQPGHLLQPQDLSLQVRGHLVERRAQHGEIVLAGDLHPLVEQAGGEALRGPGGEPDRPDDEPGDEPHDDREQHDQAGADDR